MSTMTLDEACLAIVDCEHKTAPIDESGDYYAIGTPAMRGNRINYDEARRISRATFEAWTRRLAPREGDLLFAREAPVGPVVRVPGTNNVAPGQRTVLLRPDPAKLDPAFGYYLLISPVQQVRLLLKAEGSTVSHLNVADVRSFQLPVLPPVEEQKRVASALGILDEKVESNLRAQIAGEELIRALVGRAFLDSADLEFAALGDYCDLVKNPVKVETLSPKDLYIGLEHMPRGSLWLHAWSSADGLGSNKSRFAEGDVLFGKLRPYFKKVGIAPIGGVCSTDILAIRPADRGDLALVAVVASSNELIDSLAAVATGTRMPRASWKDIAAWPVPRLSFQTRQELARNTEPIIARMISLTRETKQLEQLRDALLPSLMDGSIRISDAERVAEEAIA